MRIVKHELFPAYIRAHHDFPGAQVIVGTLVHAQLLIHAVYPCKDDVGEFPGCYDVFGGHIDVPPNENSPNVFSSMAQELKEEVGLDRSDYDLYLIGLIESTPNRKPELVFFASTFLTKKQILSRTHEAQDHIEFTHVHAIENGVELLNFLKTNKSGFSPSAFGSLCVYAKLYLTDVRKSRGY